MHFRSFANAALFLVGGLILAAASPAFAQAEARPDPLAPLARFIGNWVGTASGESGEGTVTRSYKPTMRGRYLHEENVSRYAAKDAGKPAEVHEHMAMFSYDKARKLIVLRQFHVEGFVNTYRLVSLPGEYPMVFESEAFENFSNSWKARESYEFSSDDEFVETFELAPPGKPYQVYSRNRLKRVQK
jgi:hypothetical protein